MARKPASSDPEKDDGVTGYLRTVDRIEPDLHMIDTGVAAASMSISLRRIADALEALGVGKTNPLARLGDEWKAAFDSRSGAEGIMPTLSAPDAAVAQPHRSDSWTTTDYEAAFVHDLCAGLRAMKPAWVQLYAWMAGRGWAPNEIDTRLDELTEETRHFVGVIRGD